MIYFKTYLKKKKIKNQFFDHELIENWKSNFEKSEKNWFFEDQFNRSSINWKKIGTTSVVQLPLDITANVCTLGNCVGFEILVLCRTEQCSLWWTNKHWITPHSAWHVCSICVVCFALSTLVCRGYTVLGGFIRAVVYSQHFVII